MTEKVQCIGCNTNLSASDRPQCKTCYGEDILEAKAIGEHEGKRDAGDDIRQRDLIDLAKGIRDGDADRANLALDLIAAHFGWTETVAKGRAAV